MSSPRQNLVAPLTHRSMSIESDMLAAMSANRRADDRPHRSGTYTFPASEQHSAAFSSSTGPPVLLRAKFAILSAGCRACFCGAREFAREFNNIVNASGSTWSRERSRTGPSRTSLPSAVSPLLHIFPYVHAPAHASRTLQTTLYAARARAYEERGGRSSARVVGVGTAAERNVLVRSATRGLFKGIGRLPSERCRHLRVLPLCAVASRLRRQKSPGEGRKKGGGGGSRRERARTRGGETQAY